MTDDAGTNANKILLHAARTDHLEMLNSVLNAQPPMPYDINCCLLYTSDAADE